MADETDEIIAVTEIPNGVRFDFSSGNARTLLGVSVEEAERQIGRVGDRVPRRQYELVPGPTPEPPIAVADLKKSPR